MTVVPLLNADDLSTLPVADVLSRFHAARDWCYAQGASSWEADAFGHWMADVHGPIVYGTFSDALPHFRYSDAGRAYYRAHAGRPCGHVHGYRWTYGQPLDTVAPVGGAR